MAVERGAAQQGQTVRLRAIFRKAGSLIDPFQIRQVEVRSNDNVVLATFTGAQIVRESLGEFYVDWFIPSNETPDVHFDRWYATALSGMDEEQFQFHFLVLPFSTTTVDAAYMTVDEGYEYLPDDTLITAIELQEGIALGQEIIEWCAGQSFLPVTESRVFDGNGRRHLPVNRPILRVSEVLTRPCGCDWTQAMVIDPCMVVISESKTLLGLGNAGRRSASYGYADPPWQLGCCSYWPNGMQNVRITGDWGRHETVPLQVKAALGALLRETLRCDDPKELPSAEFESESFPGDRTYVLRKVWSNIKANDATGYPSVDAILSRFEKQIEAGTV